MLINHDVGTLHCRWHIVEDTCLLYTYCWIGCENVVWGTRTTNRPEQTFAVVY